jgi:molybdopterin molybdotransferase
MLNLFEVYEVLDREIRPLGSQVEPLESTVNSILASELNAPSDYPTFDQSAMDGYVLHPEDLDATTQTLKVTGTIQAGSQCIPALDPGAVLRVFTGAPLPINAGAVRIQESTRPTSKNEIELDSPTANGANIRSRASDIFKGQSLLPVGHRVRVADLVGLANLKVEFLEVFRKPRVMVTTSGNELVDLHGPDLKFGQVVDGNRVFLQAALTPHVDTLIVSPRLADTNAETQSFLSQIEQTDLVVTCGAMSVGDFDVLGQCVRAESEVLFYKIAIKPGKPVLVARVGEAVFIGLPGNPVSALVGFHLIVKPIIRLLSGSKTPFPSTQSVLLNGSLPAGGSRLELLRGTMSTDDAGRPLVTPMRKQGSNAVSGSLGCDCLIIKPKYQPPLNCGAHVLVYRFETTDDGSSLQQFKSVEWPGWAQDFAKP